MLALVLALSVAQVPADEMLRSDHQFRTRRAGGRSGYTYAFFELAPVSGLGMPTTAGCYNASAITGVHGEAISFSRASVAEVYSNDGQTLTQCGVNQVRVASGTAASSWLGVWRDSIGSNNLAYARDFSQANWTKTSMTCTKTATGMRNDANGASLCTATGANGVVSQFAASITTATPSISSVHIKRVTGTGTVSVSIDGTTYTDITASLSTTLWRRVVPTETAGCAGGNCIVVPGMNAAVAAAGLAIKLGTSGDAVALDFAQTEWQTYSNVATTPIETGASAGIIRQSEYMQVVLGTPLAANNVSMRAHLTGNLGMSNAGAGTLLYLDGTSSTTYGGSTQVAKLDTGNFSLSAVSACSAGGSNGLALTPVNGVTLDSTIACNFTSTITGTNVFNSMGSNPSLGGTFNQTLQWLSIGGQPVRNWSEANGVVKGVCVDVAGRCSSWGAVDPILPAHAVWIGDSISAGTGSAPWTPPATVAATKGRKVWNAGVGGQTTAGCVTAYNAWAAQAFGTLFWACGTNDITGAGTGAPAATAAQVALAAARAAGRTVIVSGILPRAGTAGWNATLEAERVAYNSSMSTWAGAHGATYVSTESMGTGANPNPLQAQYDYGDGLHITRAGGLAFGALMSAGWP